MQPIKNILIFHQPGMEALAPYVQGAISDLMDCFPEFKPFFPIQTIGNWASPNAYHRENGRTFLRPHESIAWYIERAKMRAASEGRWHNNAGQINVSQMLDDLARDPYFQRIPQWGIYLTKHDLYGGEANGFCLGCTIPNAFTVISTRRFLHSNEFDLPNFKTLVQHEFGHIIRLTEGNRPSVYKSLGEHCTDPNCIMQQRLSGDLSDVTARVQERKRHGIPPICPLCITQGRKTLYNLFVQHTRTANPNYGPNGGRG